MGVPLEPNVLSISLESLEHITGCRKEHMTKSLRMLNGYTVAMICDFQTGLTSRIMDVYRFFRKPPHIILIRRGVRILTDPRLTVQTESIPLPVITHQRKGPLNRISAVTSVVGYLLYSVILFARLRHAKKDIRLVHAHFIFPQGLFGLLLASLLRVPLIITAVGMDINAIMRASSLFRICSIFVLRRASVIIAVSKALQQHLRAFGIRDSIYLPNSVDPSSITTVRHFIGGHSVLFVGSLTENKRPMLLLHAFEEVVKKIPSATLRICGDGPLRSVIQDEIQKKGLQKTVKLFGHISPELLNKIRSKAGVFVLPSAFEGLSLALLEALAAGQTVIASRNESHISVLEHGRTGLLFEPDDSDQLAQLLTLAIMDNQVRRKLSRSGRHIVEKYFSSTVVANQLENIYSEAIATKDPRLGKAPRRRR